MIKSISYYYRVLRFMYSTDNPNSICKRNTYCGETLHLLLFLSISFFILFITFAVLSIVGYLTAISLYKATGNDIGCQLKPAHTNCKITSEPMCHFGHAKNIAECILLGSISIPLIGIICCILFVISRCKQDVYTSFTSAQELTGISVDLFYHKKKF